MRANKKIWIEIILLILLLDINGFIYQGAIVRSFYVEHQRPQIIIENRKQISQKVVKSLICKPFKFFLLDNKTVWVKPLYDNRRIMLCDSLSTFFPVKETIASPDGKKIAAVLHGTSQNDVLALVDFSGSIPQKEYIHPSLEKNDNWITDVCIMDRYKAGDLSWTDNKILAYTSVISVDNSDTCIASESIIYRMVHTIGQGERIVKKNREIGIYLNDKLVVLKELPTRSERNQLLSLAKNPKDRTTLVDLFSKIDMAKEQYLLF